MKYVNVYLSARDVPAPYLEATKELGESLAESGYGTVFGASDSGAMGVLADAVLAKNGVIIGISMEMLRDSARADLTETIIAPSLDERKDLMDQRSDAFIVMPGGVGTLDEVAKVMELKKQRVHNRPIIFVNTNGFWDDFRRQLTRMEDEGFLKNPIDELVTFCATPKEAIISLDHALTQHMETSERHCTRTAVFVILERDNHVFLLRRANTGWRDGMLTLPSGHVDKGQTVREAAVVEAREEAMVEIDEADLEFVHVDYLRDLYTNFYFRARKWTGEPTLGEPHLASEVLWAPKDALPKDVVPQLKPMFAGIARGEHFSEWDEN